MNFNYQLQIILLFSFILGTIIGSFINCLAYRIHKKETILGRSYCPYCKKQIAWYDNIPILSFIILRGKCRYCGKKISIQHPIVETITGFLFILPIINSPIFANGQLLIANYRWLLIIRDWTFISILVIIFIYDLYWKLIPDKISLPAMVIALFFNLLLKYSLQNLLLASAIIGGFFLIQFLISEKWIGGGDIRLGILMGLMLGFPNILIALFIAYILGSVTGIFLIFIKQKKWKSEIPFGPFLSTATIITMLWGNFLLQKYIEFMSL